MSLRRNVDPPNLNGGDYYSVRRPTTPTHSNPNINTGSPLKTSSNNYPSSPYQSERTPSNPNINREATASPQRVMSKSLLDLKRELEEIEGSATPFSRPPEVAPVTKAVSPGYPQSPPQSHHPNPLPQTTPTRQPVGRQAPPVESPHHPQAPGSIQRHSFPGFSSYQPNPRANPSIPQPWPRGYSDLPEQLVAKISSFLSEVEDLHSVMLTCKKWCITFYQEETWKQLCFLNIPDVQDQDIVAYQNSWRNLYIHLLKTSYFYLPSMYTHIYFARKKKPVFYNSRFLTVLFPTGDLIQFVVPVSSTVGQIIMIIAQAIDITNLTVLYNLQKREGDYAKPQWLQRDKTLDEQGIEERHILRFCQQYFLPCAQFSAKHATLLYPQIQANIMSGFYTCTKEEAIILGAVQLIANYAKNAEKKTNSIVKATLPTRFHSEPDIGLEILNGYYQIIESSYLSKIDAKFLYLELASKLMTFGATIFPLNNSAVSIAICPDNMYIMKTATEHVIDQWKLLSIESFEKKQESIFLKFGKFHIPVEITPKPSDTAEILQCIQYYLKFIADCKLGKLQIPVTFCIKFGQKEDKIIYKTCSSLSTRIDEVIKEFEMAHGLKKDINWGFLLANGEWLKPVNYLGFCDVTSLTEKGIEYRPFRVPTVVQLADNSLMLLNLDHSEPVEKVIREISDTIGISYVGLNLLYENKMLNITECLSKQGVTVESESPLNCLHCVLPIHDMWNEISLDIAYTRAKIVLNRFTIPYLSPEDLRELNALQQRIDSGAGGPLARLPSIHRFIYIITKEIIFGVTYNEESCSFAVGETTLRLKSNNSENVDISVKIEDVAEYIRILDGIVLRCPKLKEKEITLKTKEYLEIHSCITAFIDIILWKQNRNNMKRKVLPMHNPDNEYALRDGKNYAEHLIQKMGQEQLEYLDLSWAGILGPELLRIAEQLKRNRSVKHINLTGYGYGLEGIVTILEAIRGSHCVETLNLCYCGLDDRMAEFVQQFLVTNRSIKKLNLVLNPFTREGIEKIYKGLLRNEVLERVDIQIPEREDAEPMKEYFERAYRLKQIQN